MPLNVMITGAGKAVGLGYHYTRTTVEKSGLESETDPTEKNNVGNVQKWVKYVEN